MTEQFDNETFLDWLDDYEVRDFVQRSHSETVRGANSQRHVYAHELEQQWPNFPWHGLTGQTCPFRDGERAYFQHDLRQIAEGRPNYD